MRHLRPAVLTLLIAALPVIAQQSAPWHDPSPHKIQLVTADTDVKLEVLDWGGTGRPIVLLAGLGDTAHVFDNFALKLTTRYHVYGITRRGFGASSAPAPEGSNYSADRLGDDVIAVLDALKLDEPVLVGHSIAGEELSSIGSRHPDRVAGLVYLDAGYPYSFYTSANGNVNVSLVNVERQLEEYKAANKPEDQKKIVENLLRKSLPELQSDLKKTEVTFLSDLPPSAAPPSAADTESYQAYCSWRMKMFDYCVPESEMRQTRKFSPGGRVGESLTAPKILQAVTDGEQKYTTIAAPILALFAVPVDFGGYVEVSSSVNSAYRAYLPHDTAFREAQAKAFETIPSAKVVRLPHATHFVFLSNEADVLRELHAFLAQLPAGNQRK